MAYLFVIFILLCANFFWVGMPLRDAQELFFQTGGTVFILASLLLARKEKISKWLGIFGIYSVALFILGGGKGGAEIMFNVFIGLMLYYATLKIDTRLVLKGIIWVCIGNVIMMFLQQIGFDFIFNIRGPNNTILYHAKDLIGFMGLKAVMGMWMSLGLITTLAINPIVALFFLVPIYISKCTGAVIGTLLGVGFYTYHIKRKLFWILTPILILTSIGYVYFVDNPMGMMNTRPVMWKMVLKDTIYGNTLKDGRFHSPFLRNPITGFGLDAFRNGRIRYYKIASTNDTVRGINNGKSIVDLTGKPFRRNGTRILTPDGKAVDWWDNPHNEAVQLFYEFGLLGMIIVGFIIFYMFKRFLYSRKTTKLVILMSLMVAFFGFCISQFPAHLARIGYLIPILLGVIVKNTEETI